MFDDQATFASAILDTVDLPLLALDSDLRVQTVNDAFLTRFEVAREKTLGRFIYDLGNGQWDIPELRRLLANILESEATLVKNYRVEHTFERIGRRVMRLNAKRIPKTDSKDSILLAIADDTERERLQEELEGRMEFADKLTDSVRESLLILHRDLRVHSANQTFYDLFKVEQGGTVGRLVYELGNGQWKIPELRRLLEDILPRDRSFDDYEVCHTFETIGSRVMLLNGRRLDHLDLILLAIRDITEQRASEQARIERDKRQSFLLSLNDAIRALAAPVSIQAAAAEQLGRHLGAGQVAYAVIDATGTWATIGRDWSDGTMPSNAGQHRLVDFGRSFIQDLQRGHTVVVADVASDHRTSAPASVSAFASRSVAAFINVPLVKNGRLVAVLAVHSMTPRSWRPSDVALAEEVAERTWAAVERAAADAALRESEARLRMALDIGRAGVWESVPATDEFSISDAALALYGLPPGTRMTHATALAAVHPDDRQRVQDALRKTFETGVPFELDLRCIRPDGTVGWLHSRAELRSHQEEKRIVGLVQDITERKRAEMLLAEREAKALAQSAEIETIYASAHVGLCVFDRDLRFRRINARLAEINGLAPADHVGRTVREVVPALADAAETIARSIFETGEPVLDLELSGETLSRPGVQRTWIEQWLPLRDGAGHIVGINVVVEDVTERKQAQERLRAAHDSLRLLVEHSPFGIYVVDADFRLAQVSDGARKVFEKVRPLLGRDFAEVLRIIWKEPFASEVIARFRHTLTTGEPHYAPNTVETRADTSAVEAYDWRLERVALADGRWGVVCHFYDLSERQRYEDHVRLLMREVNHRSKNLLSLIQAVAHRTAAAHPHDFLARFDDRIHALAACHDLLVRNEWRSVPIIDLLRSQLGHFEDLIGSRITWAGPTLLLSPQAAQALGMALHELATNAAKYGALSDESGRVDVGWSLDPAAGEAADFAIRWLESGGPIVAKPQRSGFGQSVMSTVLEMNTGGKVRLEHAPTGVTWMFSCNSGNIVERGAAAALEKTTEFDG